VTIDLNPRQEKRLSELARRSGKPAAEILGQILDAALFAREGTDVERSGGQPSPGFHDAQTDLSALIAAQGVKPVDRFEHLLGDFWPEDESADDFLAAVGDWRHEGRGVAPTE
jgi:hypothetical protein